MKELIGKTIVEVEKADYDQLGDGESVGELYRFTCSDGSRLLYSVQGGDGSYYATVDRISQKALDEKLIPPFEDEDGRFIIPFRSLAGDLLDE